ncbi:hypothetical protein FD755_022243, partial [Muntiacus reevesi]
SENRCWNAVIHCWWRLEWKLQSDKLPSIPAMCFHHDCPECRAGVDLEKKVFKLRNYLSIENLKIKKILFNENPFDDFCIDLWGWCDMQKHLLKGDGPEPSPLKVYIIPFANPDPDRSASSAELDAEHSQKVLEMEQTQQLKLKERQKFFEEAFQQDMEQYLSTGYLQIAERREPMGSMSSMEVNVDVLEQMDLMDISDQEALDVFLNSGGEENTLLSPVSGPEASPGQDAVTLQVPTPSQPPATPPSSSSPGTDPASRDPSEGGESPVVQSDEEGVEVDTALATLHTDDSDS